MLSTFLFQQELGHSHNLNKVKPESHSVNNSVSNVWDSLPIFWSPKGCDRHTFKALPHIARAAFLPEWGLISFRDIAFLVGHPVGIPTMLSYPATTGLRLRSPRACLRLFSWTLTLPHGAKPPILSILPSVLEFSRATWAAPSTMAFTGLSGC